VKTLPSGLVEKLSRRSVEFFPSPMVILMLRTLKKELKGSSGYLLDVGSASAKYFRIFEHFRYLGLDINKEVLRLAREDPLRSSAHLICASAVNLPLADDSVDAIVSTHTLVYLDEVDLRLAIGSIDRVRRSNSTVILHIERRQLPTLEEFNLIDGARLIEVHSSLSRSFEKYWHSRVGRRDARVLLQIAGFLIAWLLSFVESALPAKRDILVISRATSSALMV